MPTLNYDYNPGKDGRAFESYGKLDSSELLQPEYLEYLKKKK